MPLKLSAFPSATSTRSPAIAPMSVFDWIDDGRGARRRRPGDVRRLLHQPRSRTISTAWARRSARPASPCRCSAARPTSPTPTPTRGKRAVDREAELIRVTRRLGGPRTVCRVLSGQRYPEVEPRAGARMGRRLHRAGAARRARARRRPRAREPLQGRLLEVPRVRPEEGRVPRAARRDPRPRSFRRAVRPVERDRRRRRSDRAAARPSPTGSSACTPATATSPTGATLDDLRQSDGTLGYSPDLRHGVTGKGLNDYDAIFRILAEHGYRGWVSIEDGMNGMDEMAESLAFLRRDGRQVFSGLRLVRWIDCEPRWSAAARSGRSTPRRSRALPESEFVAACDVELRACRGVRRAATARGRSTDVATMLAETGVAGRRDRHAAPAPRRAGDPGRARRACTCWSRSRWRRASPTATPCSPRRARTRRQARRHQPAPVVRAGPAHEGGHRRRQDRHGRCSASSRCIAGATRPITSPTPGAGRWDTEGGGVLVNQSPHQLDLLHWLMDDEVDEVSGYWANLNHPVDRGRGHAPWRSLRFRERRPRLDRRPACRRNRASTPRCTSTAPTARRSASRPTAARPSSPACPTIAEPPLNDLWTIPGEEDDLARFQAEDRARFREIDASTTTTPSDPGLPPSRNRRSAPAGDRRRRPPRGGDLPGHL